MPKEVKRTVFLDMDGVIADFDKAYKEQGFDKPKQAAITAGFYRSLPVMPEAKENVARLRNWFDLYVATAPKWVNPYCMMEKQEWLKEHFPRLYKERRLIITPNKGKLHGDFLIDDHPEWNGCKDFSGKVIKFVGDWTEVWEELANHI